MSVRRFLGFVIALLSLSAAPLTTFAQSGKATAPGASSSPTSAVPPATNAGADETYVLGLADVIEVSVLGRKDFDTEGRVNEDGTVQLPYLGSVPAAGRTPTALEAQVAQALISGGFFTKPVVKVDVKTFGSRFVTVLGDVGKPGLVPMDRPYRVSEILARVGGVNPAGADYVILRSASGGSQKLWVRSLASGDKSDDPVVSPGDKIYAPVADLVYVSGAVNKPGEYKVTQDMTVRLAIGVAGGVNQEGSDKKVKLTRKGVKTKVKLDSKVEPGDVIVIGERLF